jgi:TetR/AcrR family transcriptional regulator, regulator of autoinduction and epiphytic fitness
MMVTAESSHEAQRPANRVERKRMQKMREILMATAQVLNKDGYHAMSMDEVAEKMDLTKATLYHYFSSKDELIAACLTLVAGEVNQRLERLADETADLTATERFRALLAEQLTILLIDYPEGGRLFVQPRDFAPEHRKLLRTFRTRHDAVFRKVIMAGVESGEFSATDPNVALRCIYGALDYTPVWVRSGSHAASRRMINTLCDVIMKMLY